MTEYFYEQLFTFLPPNTKDEVLQSLDKQRVQCKGYTKLKNVPPKLLLLLFKASYTDSKKLLETIINVYMKEPLKKSQYTTLLTQDSSEVHDIVKLCIYALQNQLETSDAQHLQRQLTTLHSQDLPSPTPSITVAPPHPVPEIKAETHTPTEKTSSIIEVKKGAEKMEYLGYIALQNEKYYNFYPLATFHDGVIEEIEDAKVDFPERGNILFWYHAAEQQAMQTTFKDSHYYLVDFRYPGLEDNYSYQGTRQYTNKKINGLELKRQGGVKDTSINNIYCIVYLQDENSLKNNNKTCYLQTPFCGVGSKVMVCHHNTLVGPYALHKDEQGFFIQPKLEQSQFILQRYKYTQSEYLESSFTSLNGKKFVILDNRFDILLTDCISDKSLLKNFTALLESEKLDVQTIDLSTHSDFWDKFEHLSFTPTAILTPALITARMEHIKELLEIQLSSVENLTDIADIVKNAILNSHKTDSHLFDELITLLGDDPAFLRKFQTHKIIADKLKEIENQIGAAQEKFEQLTTQIQLLQENKNAAEQGVRYSEELQSEIDQLQKEVNHLKEDIDSKTQTLTDVGVAFDLGGKTYALQIEKASLEQDIADLKKSKGSLSDELDSILATAENNAAKVKLNGLLTSKMLSAFSEHQENEITLQLSEESNSLSTIECISFADADLIEYLCNEVLKYRPQYSKNTILNLFICIAQNFLTVFSGNPGTGKTSINNIISHVLGLDAFDTFIPTQNPWTNAKFANRYIPVSVEHGWTSKRDFIGYYNPLTKSFDSCNYHMYHSLKLLDYESRNNCSTYPFFVLLDEANLSPMEYYWADFMNICDDWNENSNVNIGESSNISVPHSLRFSATINNDHTTETLSPRLIDRSWIISLPQTTEVPIGDLVLNPVSAPVSWKALQDAFSVSLTDNIVLSDLSKEILNKIQEKFKDIGVSFAPRTNKAIFKYWFIAQNLFEEEDSIDPSIIAIDYAVAQKLLPKINGVGPSYKLFLEDLQKYCIAQNLVHSNEILSKILRNGDSMEYYKFFN